ncbi:CTN [Linum grandiflorum]
MGSRLKRDRKRKLEDSESDGSGSDSSPRRSSRSRSEAQKKKKTTSRKITDDEIAEYMAKRAQRKAVKVAKKLKGQSTVSGYSNDSNPFGDSNLNETFVWMKKIEKDVYQGARLDDYSVKAEKKRQKERMSEIEKVNKRREDWAVERAQREEVTALVARERARAEFEDLEKKEDEFHYVQSKFRSEIRVREGRVKPIDVLINRSGSYLVFQGLTLKELEELHDDIKLHLEMERSAQTCHVEYWDALSVVCNWELLEARKKEALDRARVRGEEPLAELLGEQERGIHGGIEAEVISLLESKTSHELDVKQSQIEDLLSSGEAREVEYWQAVLKRLPIYKAKAVLKEIHAKMSPTHSKRCLEPTLEAEENKWEDVETVYGEPVEETQEAEEEAGSFSPEMLHGDEDEEEAIDPEEDKALQEKKRSAVLEEQQRRIREAMASKPPLPPADNFKVKAMKAMGMMEEGDSVFGSGAEVNLDSSGVYWWHDKYRPRKPKYFNRVHTGYEWNKYNQTHYDHDNPPPKSVQGYKFNIFYPDLVDKTKAPTYTIDRDGSSDETCIIRFHAGPPYEDIAFRIVNKEWELSHKKGFKCTFERGILHVYFNFKRLRYRR